MYLSSYHPLCWTQWDIFPENQLKINTKKKKKRRLPVCSCSLTGFRLLLCFFCRLDLNIRWGGVTEQNSSSLPIQKNNFVVVVFLSGEEWRKIRLTGDRQVELGCTDLQYAVPQTHPNTLVFSSGVFIQSILPSFLHVYISSVFFIIYIFYYSLFCPTVTWTFCSLAMPHQPKGHIWPEETQPKLM